MTIAHEILQAAQKHMNDRSASYGMAWVRGWDKAKVEAI